MHSEDTGSFKDGDLIIGLHKTSPPPDLTSLKCPCASPRCFLLCSIFSYEEKITKHIKRLKPQFEDTEKSSEPDIAWVLELSDWEFKPILMNMLRSPVDEAISPQDQMDNVSTETGILRNV